MKTIEIKGDVVSDSMKWIYDFFGEPAISPADITAALQEAAGDDVEVLINSNGGDVFAASEIFTKLKDSASKVTVKVTGLAASAASVIAMAGDVVKISPTAQIMIHNAASAAYGDYHDHEHTVGILKNVNTSIANAYQMKTGRGLDELLNLMEGEAWLNAQKATELGLADEVMFAENEEMPQLVNAYEKPAFSQNVVAKMQSMKPALLKEKEGPTMTVKLDTEQLQAAFDEAFSKFKNNTIVNGKSLQEWEKQAEKQEDQKPEEPRNTGFKRFLF